MDDLTPAMRQYAQLKKSYPDCLILFRMGDFYECFYEDAVTASRVLDITLTARGKGAKKAPLAGIPYHALNQYLSRLVKAGLKVAIAEQLENPKDARGRLVKRGITRIITPGTVIEPELLENKSNSFIISIFLRGSAGLAVADVSTGEFYVQSVSSREELFSEISALSPKEALLPKSLEVDTELAKFIKDRGILPTFCEDSIFSSELAAQQIKEVFPSASFLGLASGSISLIEKSTGALISYLKENHLDLSNLSKIKTLSQKEAMSLDYITLRNLEVFENIYEKSGQRTLLKMLDCCSTPMGSRQLRKVLSKPLISKQEIEKRLSAVDELSGNKILRDNLSDCLKGISDMQRLATKISAGSATPKDLVALKNSFSILPRVAGLLSASTSALLKQVSLLPALREEMELIAKTLKDEPGLKPSEGNVIREGFSEELDELRTLKSQGRNYIARLEEKERQRTGIPGLKVGYNRVFGYYIQISKGKASSLPHDYMQRQTLANSARYITEELKELEDRILSAEEKISELEQRFFAQLLEKLKASVSGIMESAEKVSLLDVLLAFASTSVLYNYTKPEIVEQGEIRIKEGRHPVVERFVDSFIPNDTELNPSEIIILTGPNMAGKSTYLRQVCLIVLMAQCGCFVPAKQAKISITDRIFTRVGASDDLTRGQSTFMVEMTETANILNNATKDSLVVLDEVGRGTSTYDGVSLAWAIAEHIYKYIKSKSIFATHYHALNKLPEEFENIKNSQMLVKEKKDEIIFLRKIAPGGTDKSYGIHVAKLAGLPVYVIERAKELQEKLIREDEMLSKVKGKKSVSQKTLADLWER
ncbi:MAG TPA: DNA mismatch repair protein MutS [Candidatus Woesearchaeota archaeon]|nr:DNA mismatch repair protein MutS [Candidatus Woesearchaeota archaeon]